MHGCTKIRIYIPRYSLMYVHVNINVLSAVSLQSTLVSKSNNRHLKARR